MKRVIAAFAIAWSGLAAAEPVVHEVTIADGWGSRAWNTPQTAYVMHVGDVLRIRNLDTTTEHTLHTPGKPCPHGGTFVYDAQGRRVHEGRNFDSIPVGGWLECELTTPFDNRRDEIYDHFQYDGVRGRIYLSVTEP